MSGTSKRKFRTKEELEEAKALDAARKAGTAPAEVDEDGNEINPHMPKYLSDAPWWMGIESSTLKHQRKSDLGESIGLDHTYQRGRKVDQKVTKFRKGACENCGAMTHKKKDCMERPRKVGAKHSGKDLQRDEVVQDIKHDYNSTRDRWNGYTPEMYMEVVKEWQEMEEELKKKGAIAKDENEDDGSDSDFDGAKMDDADAAPIENKDSRRPTTTRSLRIREDPAKYLIDLREKSAYYDPKSRSMREAAIKVNKNGEIIKYDGDVFVKEDAVTILNQERFAWDARKNDVQVNNVAMPSQAEFLYKEFMAKKEKLKQLQQNSLKEKYGDNTHSSLPKSVTGSSSSHFAEYTADGRLIKETSAPKIKENEMEDEKVQEETKPVEELMRENVFFGEHTSVWGSYWSKYRGWGFKCCFQTTREEKCLGEKGKKIALEAELKAFREAKAREAEEQALAKSEAAAAAAKKDDDGFQKPVSKLSDMRGGQKNLYDDDGSQDLDDKKLKEALKKEEKRQQKYESDDRKRDFNSIAGENDSLTKEELEAYRLKRQKFDDPMANLC